MTISAGLRRQVIERADNRCEYCGLAQTGQEAAFHIDHIAPVAGGGGTNLENLALACVSCSLRKGARQAVDKVTGAATKAPSPPPGGHSPVRTQFKQWLAPIFSDV